MSILNVDKIQPIGGGSTITVDATDIQASTGTIRASTFSGDVSATGIGVTSLSVAGVSTFSGNLILPDNTKLVAGSGTDLEIYHDGTFNYIAAPNNHEVHINANSGGSTENMAKFKPNGSVELFFDNSKKLETTGYGINITAHSDIRFTNGNWTGDIINGKIQLHNNILYLCSGTEGFTFREGNTDRWRIDPNGHFLPAADSTYDIGTSGVRVRNFYADTLYGDGSNLTNITQTTINNNATTKFITGTNNANELDCEANLSYNNSLVTFSSSSLMVDKGSNATVSVKETSGNKEAQFRANTDGGLLRTIGNYPLILGTNQTERLRIESSGRVLVNTTTGFAGDNTMIISGESPSGGTYDLYGGQLLITSNETSGAVNTGGVIQFYGHDGGSSRGFGSIRCLKENGTSGNHNAYMAFLLRVNGGNPTERLRITSDGKIGINDTAPERTMDVRGSNCMIQLEGTAGSGRQWSLCSTDSATGTGVDGGPAGTFVIYDDTASQARLRIDSGGNARFIVSGGSFTAEGTGAYGMSIHNTNSPSMGHLFIYGDNGLIRFRNNSSVYTCQMGYSESSNTMFFANQEGGTTMYITGDGVKLFDNNKFLCGNDEDLGLHHNNSNAYIDNTTGALIFRTTGSNTERVRIESGGVLKGTHPFIFGNHTGFGGIASNQGCRIVGGTGSHPACLSLDGGGTPTLEIGSTSGQTIIGSNSYNNSPMNFKSGMGIATLSGGTTRFQINSNGNIGAPTGNNIYNASDERLKENMIELTDGLSKIQKLKPISFTWKEGWDVNLDGKKEYGFGAQTTEAVDEMLVEPFSLDDAELNGEIIEKPLRVNEKYIIPLLVKAIQELSAKVAALEGS